MKMHNSFQGILLAILTVTGCVHGPRSGDVSNRSKLTPTDLSSIRGANYRGAGATNTIDYWAHYNAAETERDLGYADRLLLNQLRVFVNYASWQADPAEFRRKLIDLAHACDRHHIGLMITVGDSQSFIGANGAINGAEIDDFVNALVLAIGHEPALAFWDASNEPDYNAAGSPPDRQAKRFEIARRVAATLHKFDRKTPVTIGVAFEVNMETLADAVDVLSFHDYLSTRGAIASDIARAKAFAARTSKQVMDTETGCVARANPYDVTLEEHMKARVGWYIWELMITKRWGDVHGVFYPDGTVRDPSIPTAVLGFFRERGPNVVLERPDREGRVTRTVADARRWLANTNGDWNSGLDIAEAAANLIESAQLAPMRELPTREVELLRRGPEDRSALKALLEREIAVLESNRK
jgi:hypothetical protein